MDLVDNSLLPFPHDHFVDCMDLWELTCGIKGIPQDKGQRLGILAIREERRSLRLRRLYHVRTHWMLCDQLTKHSGYVSKSLLEFLTSGYWTVEGSIRVREHFGRDTEHLSLVDTPSSEPSGAEPFLTLHHLLELFGQIQQSSSEKNVSQ
jgi:hypothetical protein